MSLTLEVRRRGRVFRQHASTVFDIVAREAIKDAAEDLAKKVEQYAPRGVTGRLAKSVAVEHKSKTSEIVVRAPYAAAVEGGRRSTGYPIHPLAEWFERKLGLAPKAAIVAAVMMSRSRKRQKGKYFLYATLQRFGPPILAHYLGPAGQAIVRELDQP